MSKKNSTDPVPPPLLQASTREMQWAEFSAAYCARQVSTPELLAKRLREQQAEFQPDGWVLLQGELMDSSWFGSLTILAVGPRNTYQAIPDGPVALGGLASRTSVVVGWLPVANLPASESEHSK